MATNGPPRIHRRRWALGLCGLLLATLLAGGCDAFVCSQEEQAALAEFPQMGGVDVRPQGNFDIGACAVYYDVDEPPDQMQRYFTEHLAAQNWTVDPAPPGGILVQAARGQFSYTVYYEDRALYPTPQPGTHVAVHVAKE